MRSQGGSLRSQRESSTARYEPRGVYLLAERLTQQGVELRKIRGPWRPMRREEKVIPVVTNGVAAIAVDTAEHAVDVSGLLNWCGVDHLEPVPNLRPPEEVTGEK